MTSIGTGYDLYTSQFSPDGRVFQIDYAGKAVDNSGTAVALRGKDGVVFAVEKIVQSKLYEPDANKRIFSVDRHVGIAVSGLVRRASAILEEINKDFICFIWCISFYVLPCPHEFATTPIYILNTNHVPSPFSCPTAAPWWIMQPTSAPATAPTLAPLCRSSTSSSASPATCTPTPSTQR